MASVYKNSTVKEYLIFFSGCISVLNMKDLALDCLIVKKLLSCTMVRYGWNLHLERVVYFYSLFMKKVCND